MEYGYAYCIMCDLLWIVTCDHASPSPSLKGDRIINSMDDVDGDVYTVKQIINVSLIV